MPRTANTQKLLQYLVTSLVDEPEGVNITQREGDGTLAFEISVAADDVGKVIGRQGRIIKAIRTLLRAAGSVNGEHIDVDVLG